MPVNLEVYRRIVTAKLYMDNHFQENIDLESISRTACLSRYHFHRLFSNIYGQTPHRYLTRRRLEHARRWLSEGTLSVSEICTDLGFDSLGSFSMLFKKETGQSPKHYRDQEIVRLQRARKEPRQFIPSCFLPSP